jgi:hypothetical protein
MKKELNALAETVHLANKKWWCDLETGKSIERNKGELLMLVITELAEACEGVRKNLMDDKLPHRKMEEVEMADAYIRLLDYAAGFCIHIREDVANGLLFENKAKSLLEICKEIGSIEHDPYWLSYTLKTIECYCVKFNLDLEGAIAEKMDYNAVRLDHTHEARKLANGKKF